MNRRILLILFAIVFFGGFLRLYKIDINPPGLYVDEVAIGLNAYDILKTGKDQYGTPYPLAFRSFGDYKMPGYIYLTAGSMALFGKDEFAIRFPSALFGTLTILVVFFLLRGLLSAHKQTQKNAEAFSLLAALLYSILPWQLQFSRGGFEVTVGVFLYAFGLLLGVWFWKTKKFIFLLGTSVLFALSMYTYHSYRITVPVTVITGLLLMLKDKTLKKPILLAALSFFVMSLPLFIFTFSPNGAMRFQQASAFLDDPFTGLLQIPSDFVILVKNYLSYFSITYLFRFGDQLNRHQIINFGLLYLWQLPFLAAGIYYLAKTKNRMLRFVALFLLIVGPIASSVVRPSPHSLRFLLGTIPYTILTICGLYQVYLQKSKMVKIIFLGTLVLAVLEFTYYLHYYYIHYPQESLLDWGGSCKEVAQQISQEKGYKYIVIDQNLACVREYFLFYSPQVKIVYGNLSWVKPKSWGIEKTLFVRPYYGNANQGTLLKNVYLPNLNKDIFAQFLNI